jgi:hypothetical protein
MSRTTKTIGDFKMRTETEVRIHKNCGGEVIELYEAEISYCLDCEYPCEGEVQTISIEDFEAGNLVL